MRTNSREGSLSLVAVTLAGGRSRGRQEARSKVIAETTESSFCGGTRKDALTRACATAFTGQFVDSEISSSNERIQD